MTRFCADPACPFRRAATKSNKETQGKRLDEHDTHTLCFRCLGVDHDMRNCESCIFSSKTFRMQSRTLEEVKRTGVWPDSYMERPPSDMHRKSKSKSVSRVKEVRRSTSKGGHHGSTDPIRSDAEDLRQASELLDAIGKGEISPVKESFESVNLHPSQEDEDQLMSGDIGDSSQEVDCQSVGLQIAQEARKVVLIPQQRMNSSRMMRMKMRRYRSLLRPSLTL